MGSPENRARAIQEAKDHLAGHPGYLDTETTGTGPGDEIVDICVIDHQGQVQIDTLIRPTIPIPPGATRVHKITNAMVQNAPTWSEVWEAVIQVLQAGPIGIYNASFDLRLLQQTHRKAGIALPLPPLDSFCIMNLYARYHGQWDPRRRSYRWQSLAKAGAQCGIRLPNSHRARDDALLARAVLQHMAG